jgi:hypothetical protein
VVSLIRSKPMRDAAKGTVCVNCNRRDGTVVAAHLQGIRAQMFGKGERIKPHDLCVADLCRTCHEQFDRYLKGNNTYARRIEMSEDFLTCILKTLLRRVDQGVLIVKGWNDT